jgi:hypothetical protein
MEQLGPMIRSSVRMDATARHIGHDPEPGLLLPRFRHSGTADPSPRPPYCGCERASDRNAPATNHSLRLGLDRSAR